MLGRILLGSILCLLLSGNTLAETECNAGYPHRDSHSHPVFANATLKLLQMFTRHGDRSPLSAVLQQDSRWDCGPAPEIHIKAEEALWPSMHAMIFEDLNQYQRTLWKGNCPPGTLTPKGASQHRQLGQSVRRVYVEELGFLSDSFDPKEMRLRSTDFERTRLSLLNMMSGLYDAGHRSNDTSLEVHTVPVIADVLIPDGFYCPRREYLLRQLKSTPEWKELQIEATALIEQTVANAALRSMVDWKTLYDVVFTHFCNHMELPRLDPYYHVSRSHLDAILNMGEDHNRLLYSGNSEISRNLTRLVGSQAWKLILSRLAAATAPEYNDPKFFVYSVHDSSLAAILGILQTSDLVWPPYASNLIFELWDDPEIGAFVHILYNGETFPLNTIGSHKPYIRLSELAAYLHNWAEDDILAACDHPHSGMK